MTSERDQQIRGLYRAALERPAAERSKFVAELSGGDGELRASVDRLLTQTNMTDVGTSAAQGETHDLATGARVGQYRIDGLVARGGMGVVYRATDTKLRRPVAIKFLSALSADADAKRRFAQEAQTASALNHPHIVTVYDVDESDGQQYIVSELVDGGTLDDWSTATRQRTWRQVVELMTGVADALATAHNAGVLHRDVKPSNILIDTNGYAKLADFGLAKLVGSFAVDARTGRDASRKTREGVVVGTVAYMSPEQAAGQLVDARSDVFSFGIVLYELLAGRRPFDGANDLETLKAIAHAAPAPLPPTVPEILRIAVDKALEKDPADRYQTMRDLVADLRRVTRKPGSSQSVDPLPSDMQVVVGVVKRNPLATAVGSAALALLIAGGVYWSLPRHANDASASPSGAPAFQIDQLTSTGDAVTPAISPDGKYVAYSRAAGSGASRGLWIRQISTASNVNVVPPDPESFVEAPTVTPDGAYVDYVKADKLQEPSLWRVPFLGGPSKLLARSVWSPVGWSPDSRRMAFIRVDVPTATSSLVVADANAGNDRVLATRSGGQSFASLFVLGAQIRPIWSPDGRQIAVYEQVPATGSRLVLVDVESGTETAVGARTPAFPEGLAWFRPSSLVLSRREMLGQRAQLALLSLPSGALTPLTNDLSSYFGVDVDGSRRSLVTSKRETRVSVWVGDADGQHGEEVVPPTPYGSSLYSLTWAAERVLYSATPNGRPATFAIDSGGGTPEPAVGDDGGSAGATSDGRTIVYASGPGGLWKRDASGRTTQITADFANDVIVMPDDRSVIYASIQNGIQSPWIVPLDGGTPKEIVHAFTSVGTLRLARDGVHLSFVSANGGWTICDLPDCANAHTLPFPANLGSGVSQWTPDGADIAYVGADLRSIWAQPVEGGAPRQIAAVAVPADRAIAAFAWSRDGRRLAALLTSTSEDIVLLSGLRP
ncbi:MAG TPA: protein kinase [Gammaproteobacteria bacterium]|nr:protein kinase [Gammaproteobacteria bacterium]